MQPISRTVSDVGARDTTGTTCNQEDDAYVGKQWLVSGEGSARCGQAFSAAKEPRSALTNDKANTIQALLSAPTRNPQRNPIGQTPSVSRSAVACKVPSSTLSAIRSVDSTGFRNVSAPVAKPAVFDKDTFHELAVACGALPTRFRDTPRFSCFNGRPASVTC